MAIARPHFIQCRHCAKRVRVNPIGRIPVYCGASCRSLSFNEMHRERTPATERQRRVILQVLAEVGLIADPAKTTEAR